MFKFTRIGGEPEYVFEIKLHSKVYTWEYANVRFPRFKKCYVGPIHIKSIINSNAVFIADGFARRCDVVNIPEEICDVIHYMYYDDTFVLGLILGDDNKYRINEFHLVGR